MLYIKFNITDSSKYTDFQKLYNHMVEVRKPDFEFKEEEGPNFDWDTMTSEEVDKALEELNTFLDKDPETERYKEFIPEYAHQFLSSYVGFDGDRAGVFGFDILSIFNYLEFGFEVEMDHLKKLDHTIGLVEFSTGNFPYGGMERFLMVLKAFNLIPIECYNGFTIYEFDWASDFKHEAINQPEKTKKYLKGENIHN